MENNLKEMEDDLQKKGRQAPKKESFLDSS
jgi:hypothetical protein